MTPTSSTPALLASSKQPPLLAASLPATQAEPPSLPTLSLSGEGYAASSHIYFSISSEGWGHSSRAMALATYLPKHQYTLASYGGALNRLQACLHPCIAIPQELKLMGSAGGFDLGRTIKENQHLAFAFADAVQAELEHIRACKAGLVVVDGRMAAVVAAGLLDIPCLVITNQSAFYPFFEAPEADSFPWIKWLGQSFDAIMNIGLSAAQDLWIPDFPPPYTVCLPNLTQNPKLKKLTRFTGPLVNFVADEVLPHPASEGFQQRVVASLGGHAYRRPLLEALLREAALLPEVEFLVLSTLDAQVALPPNLRLIQDCTDSSPYFKSADLVITQAGHSTAMELMVLGKPCIVVPDTNQSEQENNARRLVELGMGCQLTYAQLEQGELGVQLDVLLKGGQLALYEAQAQHYYQLAKQLSSTQSAALMLQHYAQRLTAY